MRVCVCVYVSFCTIMQSFKVRYLKRRPLFRPPCFDFSVVSYPQPPKPPAEVIMYISEVGQRAVYLFWPK